MLDASLNCNLKAYKWFLNLALQAAVKGCNTSKLSQSIEIVNNLLNAGANINSEEAKEGKTALILACEKGYIELVKFILDQEGVIIDHTD